VRRLRGCEKIQKDTYLCKPSQDDPNRDVIQEDPSAKTPQDDLKVEHFSAIIVAQNLTFIERFDIICGLLFFQPAGETGKSAFERYSPCHNPPSLPLKNAPW
jgi:hypothetical protein